MKSPLRWECKTRGPRSCCTRTWQWFGRKSSYIRTWIGALWQALMSACWIGANISYQPYGIDQVIVGHDGRIEDMERTVVPKNKNGEYLHGTMKVQCTMTTTTAMMWVPHPNLLVEEVALNITAVLHPNPLVEEVAASTTAATLVRQQTVRIGTHQEIHGKWIGVLRIGVQIHGMRTRPTKIPARIHRIYTRIIGIHHGDH